MVLQSRLLLLFFLLLISFHSFSQDVTGIWKGYFITSGGEHYRLEFQVLQNAKGMAAVTGVSYSWQDDIRFYGKATMTGSYIRSSKNFRIKEIKTVEIQSAMGTGACIMNYNLAYSRSGKEEYLEGTYLGKTEVKGRPNPYEWGECGSGKVFLRRVVNSDFYIEPFLRNKIKTTTPPPATDTIVKKTSPPVVKKTPVIVKTNPVKKPVTKTNPPVVIKKPVVTTKPDQPVQQRIDSAVKINPPVVKNPVKPFINTPAILKERTNELMKSLTVNDRDVTVRLYDNGEIDGDSISIYYDKKLLLIHQGLSTAPITVKLKLEDDDEVHELVMVAENLGRIPPNTALMIVDAGDQRFEVRITSTEQKNALVRFKYEKPK